MRNTFLVTYDISNDLRLRRVHKTMLGYVVVPLRNQRPCLRSRPVCGLSTSSVVVPLKVQWLQ